VIGRLQLLAGRGAPLAALPRVLARAFGDRPALAGAAPLPGLEEGAGTYAALDRCIGRLAAAYAAAGVGGATVGIACANRSDIALHVFALARAGAVPLPINHRLKPEEQRSVLSAAEAKAVVADAGLPLLAGDLPEGLSVIWTGVGTAPPAGSFDLPAWLLTRPVETLDPPEASDVDATALILCTSGTTGAPKVVRLSSRSLLGAIGRLHALPIGFQRGLRPGRDAVLAALPLTHVMGLSTMLGSLCTGIRVLHVERFEAQAVLDRIEADQPNVFVGVPTMYADLEAAGAASRDLGSIELWVSAADVMPEERARRFQRYGALARPFGRPLGTAFFGDVYGMVELGGAAAVRIYPPGPRGRAIPAVGIVLPGFSARVVDEAGNPRGLGAPGELQLKGKGVAQDDGEGWFSTGDVARLGPAGTFAFVGRTADRIKVGGFSVFPAEVEQELRGFPGVTDLAVVGVPDDRLGEVPVALVVAGEGFLADELVAWAADRVAAYRRPRLALVVHSLPRGRNAKLDRRAARDLAHRLVTGKAPA
jgi:acyl-CoA synthetase (AMP-forming)/AMP-acid ligase II